MTATDGRPRAGGDPGPSDPSDAPHRGGPGDAGAPLPAGPAIARVRARASSVAARSGRPAPGPVPPGLARRVGRHARPETESTGHTPPPDYRPRHAARADPGPPPDEDPSDQDPSDQDPSDEFPSDEFPPDRDGSEQDSSDSVEWTRPPAGPPTPPAPPDVEIDPTPVRGLPLASTFPASAVMASESVPSESKKPLYGWEPDPGHPEIVGGGSAPARQRIVLAERRSPTRAIGTVAEIEQQTATGELLLSNLMRSQLMLAVRLAVVGVIVLGVLPVVFLTMPAAGATHVFGVALPWVLLGVLAFPFLLVLGWLYTRTAERNELDFADDVED